MRSPIGRSIVALLAGMFAGILLSLGTDVVLHTAHVFPPWGASMVGPDRTHLLSSAKNAKLKIGAEFLQVYI
jgi:hypothetical protein